MQQKLLYHRNLPRWWHGIIITLISLGSIGGMWMPLQANHSCWHGTKPLHWYDSTEKITHSYCVPEEGGGGETGGRFPTSQPLCPNPDQCWEVLREFTWLDGQPATLWGDPEGIGQNPEWIYESTSTFSEEGITLWRDEQIIAQLEVEGLIGRP